MVDMASLMDDQITGGQYSYSAMAAEIERLQQRIKELEERGEPILWIDPRNLREALKCTEGALHYLTRKPLIDDVPLYLAPSPEDKYRMTGEWIHVADKMPPPNMPVLAFVPSFMRGENSRRIRAQYAPPRTLEMADECDGGEYAENTDTYYCEAGWYETNAYEEINWHVCDDVTHWMPLPEAPY